MKDYFVWLAKLLTLVAIVFVIVPLFLGGVIVATQEEFANISGSSKKVVAVVELTGIIENAKDTVDELYRQAENNSVHGIVLRINSPGGAVGPSQDIYSTVRKLKDKKPIVVSMDALAASGGLYAALGASKIYAQSGTLTGSIGVIMQIPNVTKISEKIGLDMVTIKSGRLKDVGNSFREMLPEEKAYLDDTVKRAHDDFITAVAEGRNLPLHKVREFSDGRIILGSQAKELNLVDAIGGVHDAARAVFEILGKPLAEKEDPKLIYPDDKFGPLKDILRSAANLPRLFEQNIKLMYIMQ